MNTLRSFVRVFKKNAHADNLLVLQAESCLSQPGDQVAAAKRCLRSGAGEKEQCRGAPRAHKAERKRLGGGGGISVVLDHLHHGRLPSMHGDSQEPTLLTLPSGLFCTSQPDFCDLLSLCVSEENEDWVYFERNSI